MKLEVLANPSARRRLAEATPSSIAADKAAYDIINQSINQLLSILAG